MSYTSLSSDTNINLHNTDRPAEMGSENPINKTFTDGVVGGHLAIGIAPYENLSIRHELEYNITGKQSNNTKVTTFTEPFDYKTSMETQALMFNTYYDFENESKFTPYVGLGVGVARLSGKIKNTSLWDNSAVGLKPGADIHGNDGSYSDTAYNFALTLSAGTSYELTENLSLDVGARYFNYGKMKSSKSLADNRWLTSPMTFNNESKTTVDGFDISLGVRYEF